MIEDSWNKTAVDDFRKRAERVAVARVGILQRIRLFLNPPTSVQAACYDEPWVGVTEEWCGRVQQRFEHQERRAEAIKMLEEKAGALKGETPAVLTKHDLITTGAALVDVECPHDVRTAEHVQVCAQCNLVLARNELAMIPPAELEGLRKMKEQMDAIALYLRGNFTREIERGEHTGRSDSAVIIGYLSRLKSQ